VPEPAATPDFPLAAHLGLTIEHGDAGRATARVRADERHVNPHGVVHGAVLFAMVDTGMGAATYSVMPGGMLCASIEVQLRFLSPAPIGATLAAAVHVVKAGKRIVQLAADVTADDRLVATATGSFALFPAG
jgi:acyl-CoA thioesterase